MAEPTSFPRRRPMILWALDNRILRGKEISVAVISIVLGLAVLAPRVASLNLPRVSIAHVMNYVAFDVAKNRAASQLLKEYYENKGDSLAANSEVKRLERTHPEVKLVYESLKYFNDGNLDRAIQLNMQAIRINPLYWNAYSNLGGGLLKKGLNDSALSILKIADGINPNNPITLAKLGYAWYSTGNEKRAEKTLIRALELDSTMTDALIFLAWMYNEEGRMDEYVETLKRILPRDNAPKEALVALMEYYLAHNKITNASSIYRRVADTGLDSAYVQALFQKYPDFQQYINR